MPKPEPEALAELRRRGCAYLVRACREPGAVRAEHAHDRRVVVYVVRGALTIITATEAWEIAHGGIFEMAPGVPHSEIAGPEGAAMIIGWC